MGKKLDWGKKKGEQYEAHHTAGLAFACSSYNNALPPSTHSFFLLFIIRLQYLQSLVKHCSNHSHYCLHIFNNLVIPSNHQLTFPNQKPQKPPKIKMQSAILVLAAVSGVANAWAGNYSISVGSSVGASYTTTTVVDTTTVACGATGTTITGTSKTYTLTAFQTSTITDCGCPKTTVIPAIPYTTTTTDIFTSTTVYCPSATTTTYGTKTYTATAVRKITKQILNESLADISRSLRPLPSPKAARAKQPRLLSTLLVSQSPLPA